MLARGNFRVSQARGEGVGVTGKGSDTNYNMELFEGYPKCGGTRREGAMYSTWKMGKPPGRGEI